MSDLDLIAKLTPREYEVLRHVAVGEPYKAVAGELGISIKTVGYYRTQITNKLGLHCIADIVRFAMRAGIIT